MGVRDGNGTSFCSELGAYRFRLVLVDSTCNRFESAISHRPRKPRRLDRPKTTESHARRVYLPPFGF